MASGFTFGGIHSDVFGLIVNHKEIPMTPPVDNRFESDGGHDGAWDYGMSYGSKPIDLECTILADSNTDLKQKIRKMAGTLNPRKGAQPIVFDDEPDMQYFGRISNQIPLSQLGGMGTFTLQFTCADPFTYSVDQKTVTVSSASTITHNGTHEALPVLTITHDGGKGTITNTRPDGLVDELTFDADSVAGTYIVDCKAMTMTHNSEAAYDDISGQFFKMPEGDNAVSISGGITSVEVAYFDTWL